MSFNATIDERTAREITSAYGRDVSVFKCFFFICCSVLWYLLLFPILCVDLLSGPRMCGVEQLN